MYEERGIKGERLAIVSAITLGQKEHLDLKKSRSLLMPDYSYNGSIGVACRNPKSVCF